MVYSSVPARGLLPPESPRAFHASVAVSLCDLGRGADTRASVEEPLHGRVVPRRAFVRKLGCALISYRLR